METARAVGCGLSDRSICGAVNGSVNRCSFFIPKRACITRGICYLDAPADSSPINRFSSGLSLLQLPPLAC